MEVITVHALEASLREDDASYDKQEALNTLTQAAVSTLQVVRELESVVDKDDKSLQDIHMWSRRLVYYVNEFYLAALSDNQAIQLPSDLESLHRLYMEQLHRPMGYLMDLFPAPVKRRTCLDLALFATEHLSKIFEKFIADGVLKRTG